jgi:CRP/FNR family cyclic AMP-dependent transcriptional regulator
MGKTPALVPDAGWLHWRALAEIGELAALLRLDPRAVDDARAELARRELDDRRVRVERRALLLLALLYGRRPLHRAATQAHRGSARARSTAVELLEAHVKDAALRAIVPLVELGAAGAPSDADASVLEDDAWLARLLRWARGGEDARLDRITKMRRVPLVAAMGGEVLEPLLASASLREVTPGTHLVRAGEIPDAMFVVTRGLLRVEVPGAPTLGPGEIVGELALIDRAPRSADVVAVEPTTVVVLGAKAFDDHLASHPTFARNLLQLLAARFRAAVEAR